MIEYDPLRWFLLASSGDFCAPTHEILLLPTPTLITVVSAFLESCGEWMRCNECNRTNYVDSLKKFTPNPKVCNKKCQSFDLFRLWYILIFFRHLHLWHNAVIYWDPYDKCIQAALPLSQFWLLLLNALSIDKSVRLRFSICKTQPKLLQILRRQCCLWCRKSHSKLRLHYQHNMIM